MKRRSFVKNVGLASVALPLVLNDIKYQAITKKLFNYSKSAGDRVLVIIRLNGGNDGLNTVIPIDQYDNLVIQRQNVIVPQASILPLTTNVGLHPKMTGMQNMYNAGKLSIIQNVGYPEQNRSHFRSMDIWSTGLMDPNSSTGWLGRNFDNQYPNFPDAYPDTANPDPFAISMGYEVSSTCQGLMGNFSHAVADPFDTFNLVDYSTANDGTYFGSHMEYLGTLIDQTNAYGSQINTAANAGNTMSSLYDANNPIAMQLQNVARLISGGLQSKVYILNINGFDTHDAQVNLNDTTNGAHADLLKTLSDAVYAFQDDIGLLGIENRVAGMTFSEFGRQIASNASLGTDHGDAAPLFIFGSCIDSGITGPNPVIDSVIQNQAGLQMQIDFRDVYASILKDWFEVPQIEVEALFEHQVSFLPVLGACNVGIDEQGKDLFQLLAYPNPASTKTTLRMTVDAGRHQIAVYDLTGRKVIEVFEGDLSNGEHNISIDIQDLTIGNYFIQVQSEKGTNSIQLNKVRSI